MSARNEQVVDGRYVVHERLGAGSAGIVYRAIDRLTGEAVALKQIAMPAGQGQSTATEDTDAQRLSLANEFQTLASLRHPHIIEVWDYGFDSGPDGQRQPYFTMEYLDDAATLLEAGADKPAATRVDLLIQALQALAYLHRLEIVHRDLKPGNVLVAGGVVRVLDFGLAAARGRAEGTVGTFAYLAPEVLAGEPASPAADLYAIGLMAYELFAGRHPFDTADVNRLIGDTMNRKPDLTALRADPGLAAVIGRLLDKGPRWRYPDAEACIAAFCDALGRPPPRESRAIRESYLQAARFVGRQAELAQLTAALDAALAGQGAAWLVGGESGVGKSRLLDELRTRALVRGALVVRGQGVEEGAAVYQWWRAPLRRLVLSAELSDLEAGSLKPIVPDIDLLLGREIEAVVDLEGEAGQRRLFDAMASAVRRQGAPVLLILEDLQWAHESLTALRHLQKSAPSLPLLIVGSYRDDEAADLPAALPGANVLKLERLSEAEMAELSASMLGQAGTRPKVLHLLQQETEGNAFFVVEVVRALARRAGRLDEVGHTTLPAQVFPKGVQAVIEQHLARVPAHAQPLLRLAAVAGRQIDLKLLGQWAEAGSALGDWLTVCANAAVLEMRDGQWRFVHDKLREGLLGSLEEAEEAALHRQVAEGIEAAYGGGPERAAALAHHWRRAQDADKERQYAGLAGKHAAAQHAYSEAATYLSRALALTPETDADGRYDLLMAREEVSHSAGDRAAQADDLAALEALTGTGFRTLNRQIDVALRRARHALATGDYPAAIEAAQMAVRLAQETGDDGQAAEGHHLWGRALTYQGAYDAARSRVAQALELARAAGSRFLEAHSLRALGLIARYTDDYAGAREYFEQAWRIYQAQGNPWGASATLNNLGVICQQLGDQDAGQAYYDQALQISREIGDRQCESLVLNNLGFASAQRGDYVEARAFFRQGLEIDREIGNRWGEGWALNDLGSIALRLGAYEEARAYYEQGLGLCREIGDRRAECTMLISQSLLSHQLGQDVDSEQYGRQALEIAEELGERHMQADAQAHLGHALLALGEFEEAADAYWRALDGWQAPGKPHLALEARAGLARLALQRDDIEEAQLQAAEILAYLDKGGRLDGTWEPLRIYLTCYRVLQATQAPRAGDVLAAAHGLLWEQAVKIPDEETRRAFLERVPAHREIARAFGRASEAWP